MANSVVINYLVKVAGVKDVETLKAKLTGLTTSKGFQNAVMGVGISAGMAAWNAVGNAARGAVDYLGDAVRAAADEEAGIARLTASLRENAAGWDGNISTIEKVISQRQELAFADDELRTSLALIVGKTKDVNEAFDVQAAAMELARFKGISLEDASKSLISALSGQMRVLKQMGIVLDSTATQEEILGAVMEVAGGQTEAYAETAKGSFENLQIAAENLQEDIGKRLLEPMTDLANVIRKDVIPALDDMADAFPDIKTEAGDTNVALLALAGGARGLGGAFGSPIDKLEEFGFGFAMLGDAIGAFNGDAEALISLYERLGKDTTELTDAVNESAYAWDTYSEKNAAARETAAKSKKPIDDLSESLGDVRTKGFGAADALDEMKKSWEELDDALEQSRSIRDLPDQITVARDEVKDAHRELRQAIKSGDDASIAAAKLKLNAARDRLADLRTDWQRLREEMQRNITIGRINATTQIGRGGRGRDDSNVPGGALGGWVGLNGPEIMRVGELGPEFIIPHKQLGGLSGTTSPIAATGPAPVSVAVYLDSEQIAARVERRQYFAASVAPVSAR